MKNIYSLVLIAFVSLQTLMAQEPQQEPVLRMQNLKVFTVIMEEEMPQQLFLECELSGYLQLEKVEVRFLGTDNQLLQSHECVIVERLGRKYLQKPDNSLEQVKEGHLRFHIAIQDIEEYDIKQVELTGFSLTGDATEVLSFNRFQN
jgi:hypothetical protein